MRDPIHESMSSIVLKYSPHDDPTHNSLVKSSSNFVFFAPCLHLPGSRDLLENGCLVAGANDRYCYQSGVGRGGRAHTEDGRRRRVFQAFSNEKDLQDATRTWVRTRTFIGGESSYKGRAIRR